LDIICGKQMPGQGCRCCCFWGGGGKCDFGGLVGRFVCRGGVALPPSSTFLVRQQRPFPGQVTLRSISSQSKVKNPDTQVPRQPTKPSLFCGSGCFGFAVVVVRFVVVLGAFVVVAGVV
jgi:hypothetical protein